MKKHAMSNNNDNKCILEILCKLQHQAAVTNSLLASILGTSGGSSTAVLNTLNSNFAVGGQYWQNAITTVINNPAANGLYGGGIAALNGIMGTVIVAATATPGCTSYPYNLLTGALESYLTVTVPSTLISLVQKNVIEYGQTITFIPYPNNSSEPGVSLTISPYIVNGAVVGATICDNGLETGTLLQLENIVQS